MLNFINKNEYDQLYTKLFVQLYYVVKFKKDMRFRFIFPSYESKFTVRSITSYLLEICNL